MCVQEGERERKRTQGKLMACVMTMGTPSVKTVSYVRTYVRTYVHTYSLSMYDCLWKLDGVRHDDGHTISQDCLSSIILESHGIWHTFESHGIWYTYVRTYVRTYILTIYVRLPVEIGWRAS